MPEPMPLFRPRRKLSHCTRFTAEKSIWETHIDVFLKILLPKLEILCFQTSSERMTIDFFSYIEIHSLA